MAPSLLRTRVRSGCASRMTTRHTTNSKPRIHGSNSGGFNGAFAVQSNDWRFFVSRSILHPHGTVVSFHKTYIVIAFWELYIIIT
jgi:hypothetical protein